MIYQLDNGVRVMDSEDWISVIIGFKSNGRLACSRQDVRRTARLLSALGPLPVYAHTPKATMYVGGKVAKGEGAI